MPVERPLVIQTPPHLEHRIQAADGRTIAVAEWGAPDGVPHIAFHGSPGGRISYWSDPSIDARHGLRRITLDRPGYGESTRHRGRAVADLVPDVEAITAALGIDRFVVSGGSGGGPHALACAALLGDRVLRCLADVSIAPRGAEGLDWLGGMTEGNVAEFEAAVAGEAAIRALTDRARATIIERLTAGRVDFWGDDYVLSEADQAQQARHLDRLADQLLNGLAPGVDGWVDDELAFVKPWGFDVASIHVPVYLSYGRADTLVPSAHGDWLAAHIPGAFAVVSEAGHLGNDDEAEQQAAWLASGELGA